MMRRMGHRLAELAWPEVAPLLDAGATPVLPVGAAAKVHGAHLPAEALGPRLAERADVLVWPTLGYGHSPAFRAYAGSTSTPEPAFEGTVLALLEDLARAARTPPLVLNTGLSTIRAIDGACREHGAARAVHVYRGARYAEIAAELLEQPRGGHADEAETSVMLHLCPERVRMARAATWVEEVRAGVWSPSDPGSPSYAPLGLYGDATRATPEKGARLVEAMLEDLCAALA